MEEPGKRKSRFTKEQIAGAPRQVEQGKPVAALAANRSHDRHPTRSLGQLARQSTILGRQLLGLHLAGRCASTRSTPTGRRWRRPRGSGR
jgi:hypothetical protein